VTARPLPGETGFGPPDRDRALSLLLVALGVALFLAAQLSNLSGEFVNNDVAGIAYEADTLLRGDLPYRDTIQHKPPASFFVFAAVFGLVGRDLHAVQLVLTAWLLFGAAGVFRAARVLWGSRLGSATAAFLYLLYAGFFELNYSSWMAPAYVWAVAELLAGLKTGSPRHNLAAGAWATLAFLFKQPGIVLGPLALSLWALSRRKQEPGATAATLAQWVGGAVAGALPIVLFYAARGALGDLVRGVLAIGEYQTHLSQVTTKAPGLADLASLVLLQLVRLFPVAVWLASLTLAGALWLAARRRPVAPLLPVLLFLFWSLLGGAMSGYRFYRHYAIQYLPALALLGAHPDGPFRLMRNGRSRSAGRALAAVSALLAVHHVYKLAAHPGVVYDRRPPLLSDGSTPARRAGEHIRARTTPEDTVYVWGWLAWPVYFWADRRAPLRAYREMGTVTTVNTNTAWSASQAFSFAPGRGADELVAAFEERRPAYFVYSPYYVWQSGGGREPLLEFDALESLLQRDYKLEATHGDLLVYARTDRRK